MATQPRGTAGETHHPLVPLSAAAEEFSVSTKTIRRRIADGTVTGYRVGRLVRVDLDDVRRALAVPIPTFRRRAETTARPPMPPRPVGGGVA